MKKLICAFVLLATAVFAFAGGNGEESGLKVGTSPDYPPFESLNEKGELIGFDIEMMNAVAAIMGEEIVYMELDFSVIISSLNSEQIDIGLSGFTYNPERDVLFSEPYYMSAQAIVLKADSKITSLTELLDKKISAGLGTTGESAVTEAYPDAEVVYPDDYLIGFEMLRVGQIDAVVCDLGVAQNFAKQDDFKMLDEYLQSEEMSIILKKDQSELMKRINTAILEYKATDEYMALLEKWELN